MQLTEVGMGDVQLQQAGQVGLVCRQFDATTTCDLPSVQQGSITMLLPGDLPCTG